MTTYLNKQQPNYTAHKVQNEFLSNTGLHILQQIASRTQTAKFFTVMLDTATDPDNKEQVVLVFRWVDDDLCSREDFLGLHLTDSITLQALVAIIKDTILRFMYHYSLLSQAWHALPQTEHSSFQ